MLLSSRYGWHRDELYFREAGKHLAWGYVDQPPFVPFVARVADEVAPGNLAVLRFLPAVAVGLSVVFASLVARELGGQRAAQTGAAAVVASGGFALGAAHLLGTPAFDLASWMVILWLTARLLRTGDTRIWAVIGAVAGASMLNKNLVALLGMALLGGIVAGGQWRLLRSPWSLAGVAIGLAIASPHLLWQASHGWPQLDMARVLSERVGRESRLMLLPGQVVLVGILYITLLWRGAGFLARDGVQRALLYAWPVALAIVLLTGGRPYYPIALTIVIAVAGVVALERDGLMRRLPMLVVPSVVLHALVALPVLPVGWANSTAALNSSAVETIGWPELVREVAAVVDGLPARERETVLILTGSYGEAGAIDRFGDTYGLPPAHSPHNGYAHFRRPHDDSATVVAVRLGRNDIGHLFDDCQDVGTISNAHNIENEALGKPILVCRGLRGTWANLWGELTFLS